MYKDKSSPIKNLCNQVLGTDVEKDIDEKRCPTCQQPVGEFRNDSSRREYSISGMCQKCQDSIFGPD